MNVKGILTYQFNSLQEFRDNYWYLNQVGHLVIGYKIDKVVPTVLKEQWLQWPGRIYKPLP